MGTELYGTYVPDDSEFEIKCNNPLCEKIIDCREHSCIYCATPQKFDESDKNED